MRALPRALGTALQMCPQSCGGGTLGSRASVLQLEGQGTGSFCVRFNSRGTCAEMWYSQGVSNLHRQWFTYQQSLHVCLWRACYVPGPVLCNGEAAENRTEKVLSLQADTLVCLSSG